MKIAKVEQMKGANGAVKNQFILSAEDGIYFQSYDKIIAFKPFNGTVQLDKTYWNYSATTGKYRCMFLRERLDDTRAKIDSGEYQLVDLNNEWEQSK